MSHQIVDLLPSCITSIVSESNDDMQITVDAQCSFPNSFSGFQGHFPEKPILPAVIQLATIRSIAEKVLKYPLNVGEYSRIKFKSMIQPNMVIFVHLILEEQEPDEIRGQFKMNNQDKKTVASGNFIFKKTHQ